MKKTRITRMMFALGLTMGIFMLGQPNSVHATSFCYVKETADGFVALRKKPSPQAKMIGRMKAGDEVMLGERKKGLWFEVTWWHGDDRLNKGFVQKSGFGWVNRKFIDEECG